MDGPFAPDGRVPPGTELPLTIDVTGGQATVGTPVLSISYDDGATWQDVDVRSVDGRWTAQVTTPDAETYASLRVRVNDGDGNAVDVTTHRAFGVGTTGADRSTGR